MQSKVLVIGEALIDIVHQNDGAIKNIPGGSPANTAVALARLQIPTFMMARTSQDKYGQIIRNYLESESVNLEYGVVSSDPSSIIDAYIQTDGSAKYEANLRGSSDFGWTNVELKFDESKFNFVHLGSLTSYIEPGASSVENWYKSLRQNNNLILSFDPNIRHPLDGQKENDVRERAIRLSKLAHIVKASDEDLKWMANSNNYLDLVDSFISNGASLVIVTKGHSGSYLKNKKGFEINMVPAKIEVVDTIGAGDTFSAAFIAQLIKLNVKNVGDLNELSKDVLTQIMSNCSIASGITCSRQGANPPSRSEVNW